MASFPLATASLAFATASSDASPPSLLFSYVLSAQSLTHNQYVTYELLFQPLDCLLDLDLHAW
jgi:hypothetical protein